MPRLPAVRPKHGLIALFALLILGWPTGRYVERHKQSPFVLFKLRAGMPFKRIEKEVVGYGSRPFTCHVAVESARLCTLRVAGIRGLLRVLVDERDRAAIVQLLPDTASPRLREEGRRLAATWNLVRHPLPQDRDDARYPPVSTRWLTQDKRWLALMRYGQHRATPIALELRDQRAVKKIMSSAPLAPLVLVMSELIDSREVRNLEDFSTRLKPALLAQATDARDETPAPATADTSAPICQPAPDLIEPNANSNGDGDSTERAQLNQVVARAYPGSRLVLGEGMWRIDATGHTERFITRRARTGGEQETSVYGAFFPSRYRLAAERMRSGLPEVFCRAPSELLFVRSGEDGLPLDVRRVPVDGDAIATEVLGVAVAPDAFTGDLPHLRVRYTAAYAGDTWSGSIEWEALILGDPPRATVRVPVRFALQPRGSEEITSGMLLVMGRSAGAIELATVEQYGRGYSSRTVRVPADSSGVLFGVRLLAQLR